MENQTVKKTHAKKVTDEQISQAIAACGELGDNITLIGAQLAEMYGVTLKRSTLYQRINESNSLKEQINEARERHLDWAEGKIAELMKEGDKTAIIFYLKTKGKARGWTERQEITGADEKPLIQPAQFYDVSKIPHDELMELTKAAFGR